MSTVKGNLSINSENIFPIIKKWLYSDHDIFVRELISNGCDAITKLKKLDMMGEAVIPEDNQYKITVTVNQEEKTIKFCDNGIGMSNDEVQEYINQIAFSGAKKFMEQYQDKTNEDQIIGHFGLGFYSAFMVAHKVTIDTLSWQQDASPVYWESDGGLEFEMGEGSKESRGTEITLYLNEDSYEFSNEYRMKEVLKKYCSFMPVEIYFINANAPAEEESKTEDSIEDDIIDETIVDENIVDEVKTEKKGPQPINNTKPLWAKHPNECSEEEYKEFYRTVFNDYKEPLFWIHLNMDYPFNLKGILYFPKINTEYDSLEGVIKLYSNQVFIADNIKEVIPEFLMLLKGVIDCPDLPLNVSRSALQNDGFVKKISDYITKKVADKLTGMYKVERESYEKFWDDISPFIKFGCLKDEKFRDKMKDAIIYKNLEGNYVSLDEYVEAKEHDVNNNCDCKDGNCDCDHEHGESCECKHDGDHGDDCGCGHDHIDEHHHNHDDGDNKAVVYYVTDEKQQSQYINMFKEAGMDAFILTHNIDQPFISQVESLNDKVKFQRIDAEITDSFREESKAEDKESLEKSTETMSSLFRKVLCKDKLDVKVEKLKNDKISSMVTLSEESRRMQDMMKMYNMQGMDPNMFGGGETLVLNGNHPLVKYMIENSESEHISMICEQLYDLAMLSHRPLDPEAMTKFILRSNEIMVLLAN